MLYVNSINIVHGSEKKIGTCTFKLNIIENRIPLLTAGGATSLIRSCYFEKFEKFVFDVTDGYA